MPPLVVWLRVSVGYRPTLPASRQSVVLAATVSVAAEVSGRTHHDRYTASTRRRRGAVYAIPRWVSGLCQDAHCGGCGVDPEVRGRLPHRRVGVAWPGPS